MTKELMMLTSLVTTANIHLQEKEKQFNLVRTLADYCHGMEFVEEPIENIAGSARVIASDVMSWFTYLKKQGAKSVKLHYIASSRSDLPDYINVAFRGGGSEWIIEIQYDSESRLYSNILYPMNKGLSHTWKTYFARVKKPSEFIDDSSPTIEEARSTMNRVLHSLQIFAKKFEHTKHWSENFGRSRQLLEADLSDSDFFIPKSIYSKEAYQLLNTAIGSWVFGGMGSWNDQAFSGDDQQQYSSLTKQLYEIICESVTSVVNRSSW